MGHCGYKLLSTLPLLFLKTLALAQSNRQVPLDSILRLGLPVVVIKTENGVEPTADELPKPDPRCVGNTITNAVKIPGSLVILAPDSTLIYDCGEYLEGVSGMTIKVRGNNSALRWPKPYKIKLEKKADLLKRGNAKKYSDKHWLLIREYENTLNTIIGLQVCRLLDYCWTPSFRQVNVVLNGEYRGIYLLGEHVRRNSRCRINVDEQTGYIIEGDIYWWSKPIWFETRMYSDYWQRYTFKYPDEDEVTDAQMSYIQQAVEVMEDAVKDQYGEYERYLDVHAYAAWSLGHDILGTWDAGGANRYLSKYDDTPESLFKMETMWDFDSNFRCSGQWSQLHNEYVTYLPRLLQSRNRIFAKEYVRAWKRLSPMIEQSIADFLDSLTLVDSAAMNASRHVEQKLGYRSFISIQQNVSDAMTWFRQRKAWMDENIAEIDTIDTRVGISSPSISDSRHASYCFSLSGNCFSGRPMQKGIYIRKRRKVLVK